MVPGYRTLNAIGVGQRRRGLLHHRLFSSTAVGFVSESAETQAALASVDAAVWATIWAQGRHLVCRVQHRDRSVRPATDQPTCHLYDLAPRLQPLARVEARIVVRKGKQPRPKLQPVTAVVAATPLVADYQEEARARAGGARHRKPVWLVEVRLEGAHEAPWWLLTDRPVTTAEAALELFRMYRQRWSIEDAFKIGKQCLGWEDVQVLTHFVEFFVDPVVGTRPGTRDKDLQILVLRHQVCLAPRQCPRPPRLAHCEKLTLAVLASALARLTAGPHGRLDQ